MLNMEVLLGITSQLHPAISVGYGLIFTDSLQKAMFEKNQGMTDVDIEKPQYASNGKRFHDVKDVIVTIRGQNSQSYDMIFLRSLSRILDISLDAQSLRIKFDKVLEHKIQHNIFYLFVNYSRYSTEENYSYMKRTSEHLKPQIKGELGVVLSKLAKRKRGSIKFEAVGQNGTKAAYIRAQAQIPGFMRKKSPNPSPRYTIYIGCQPIDNYYAHKKENDDRYIYTLGYSAVITSPGIENETIKGVAKSAYIDNLYILALLLAFYNSVKTIGPQDDVQVTLVTKESEFKEFLSSDFDATGYETQIQNVLTRILSIIKCFKQVIVIPISDESKAVADSKEYMNFCEETSDTANQEYKKRTKRAERKQKKAQQAKDDAATAAAKRELAVFLRKEVRKINQKRTQQQQEAAKKRKKEQKRKKKQQQKKEKEARS